MDKVEAFLTKIEDEQSDAIDQGDDPSLYMEDANKLIDLVRVYREANQIFIELLESGWLVRDISRDSQPGWILEQLKFVPKLAEANAAEEKAKEIVDG